MSEIPKHELLVYRNLSDEFDVVFDVGSRDDIDYFEINPNCEYHLFEPHIVALNSIKDKLSKLKEHHIILNEFGLFDENLDNQVYYQNTQSFIKHWSVASKDEGHKYSLKKLDDYVESKNVKKIDFLKIDVEGVDYKVLLGGLKTLKEKDVVSFIQIEYSGGIRQYVDLLGNFNWFLMIEPRLLEVINKFNDIGVDFNKTLVKLNDEVITFIDEKLKGTGAGGNIFGVNKKIDLDIIEKKGLIVKLKKD